MILYERRQTGSDAFGAPVYEEVPVTVENVLVAPVSAEEVIGGLQLHGRRAEYELYLPQGDSRQWEGCRVDFFGQSFFVFTAPVEYMQELLPGNWNKRVKVERYG